MHTRSLALTALLAIITTTACGVETVVHKIDEKQANNIIVLLAEEQISAKKIVIDDGRNITYNVSVPAKSKIPALRTLELHDFPKRPVDDYARVFAEGGLIPTAAEEKARKLQSLEGEIEKQLRLINGVQDVQVNIVMPEDSALKTNEDAFTPTTASVTIKYMPTKSNVKPIDDHKVQAIVAASVEKLTRDHVVVVMTPAGIAGKAAATEEVDCSKEPGVGFLGKLKPKHQTFIAAGALILVLMLGLFTIFGQMRLRAVRGRLIRLQNEIASARRK